MRQSSTDLAGEHRTSQLWKLSYARALISLLVLLSVPCSSRGHVLILVDLVEVLVGLFLVLIVAHQLRCSRDSCWMFSNNA